MRGGLHSNDIPEVKKYLGGQIRVRRLDSIRLRHALKSAEKIEASAILVPNKYELVPYVAFLNEESGKLFTILVEEKLTTPDKLNTLLEDVAEKMEETLDEESSSQQE